MDQAALSQKIALHLLDRGEEIARICQLTQLPAKQVIDLAISHYPTGRSKKNQRRLELMKKLSMGKSVFPLVPGPKVKLNSIT